MTNPEIDALLDDEQKWVEVVDQLRPIVLESGLTEELKWKKPCYTLDNANVAMIYRMKDFCALGFFKGTLLKDERGLLTAPGENSQHMRWFQFVTAEEVAVLEPAVRDYLAEAIEIERAGLTVKRKQIDDYEIPGELQARLDTDPALKTAFDALTPGRQRGYILHFSGAKKSETRASRVEKYVPRILEGKGMNDRD